MIKIATAIGQVGSYLEEKKKQEKLSPAEEKLLERLMQEDNPIIKAEVSETFEAKNVAYILQVLFVAKDLAIKYPQTAGKHTLCNYYKIMLQNLHINDKEEEAKLFSKMVMAEN